MEIPYTMPGCLASIARDATQQIIGLRDTMVRTPESQMRVGAESTMEARRAETVIHKPCALRPASHAMTATAQATKVEEIEL